VNIHDKAEIFNCPPDSSVVFPEGQGKYENNVPQNVELLLRRKWCFGVPRKNRAFTDGVTYETKTQ